MKQGPCASASYLLDRALDGAQPYALLHRPGATGPEGVEALPARCPCPS